MSEENKVRDAADAVKGVFEAVPIHQDALQPAAKELGVGLQTVAKTIHIALAPISALVWGYEQIQEYITEALSSRLKRLPADQIITPSPAVAGPTLEALRFAGYEPTLRELYANLLATAMDAQTATDAHPAFVEILKQLTPDEARIMQLFAVRLAFPMLKVDCQFRESQTSEAFVEGFRALRNFSLLAEEANCSCPKLSESYIDNLCRLGLVEIIDDMVHPKTYQALENHPAVLKLMSQALQDGDRTIHLQRQTVLVTSLGRQFCRACVVEHSAQ
ncbi:DUF4393 domain-containing protein [Leptolyngbya sp. FACHB-541]|uniref:DUF4393 domain-containing protein n=1 Tax=Leptolyngbya sp. FACHB-541 TaxID=2692810 RepID=UPI001684B1CA|nr:DUF4393 domain-containing protein [Leptolyngbya sp. FACHB-541]MBD1995035.1 DUF4393 domain-containing protein [Leptolyngbya sp. FACHB-541]